MRKDQFKASLVIEQNQGDKKTPSFVKVEELRRVTPEQAHEVLELKYVTPKKKGFLATSVELFDEMVTSKRLKEEIQKKKNG